VLEVSNGYRTVDVDSMAEIQEWFRRGGPQWREKIDLRGDRVVMRYGAVRIDGKQYLLVLGRRFGDMQNLPSLFLTNYFAALPVILLLTGLVGWFMAHRALAPVSELAMAAEKISGSTLDVRLPEKDAGVEIDTLVHAFNRMMDRLKESFEQIRRFSTDVSHELRTPLTGIRGQLEVALFTGDTVEQYREATVNALQDVDRLSNIVRALLLLSQAETGQLHLKHQPLRLAELVKEHVEEFAIPAEEAGLTITSELDERLAVEADRTQMDRLIANLLSNAVKYTPAGGKVHVVLRQGAAGEVVELVVRDTGQGITPEDMPFIFDRFYKAPNADPEKGLGLGLSFVAWIVKVHQGTIHVESEPGKGTQFTVRLPLGKAEEAEAKAEAALESQSAK
jgi:heavy metal sensor kinase